MENNSKLASIEAVVEVFPHPNADSLEFVKVLGYNCLVPIGKYKVGDLGVLIQPDTCLPTNQEWATSFLKYAPKRVKSMKFRGEWSFGIFADLNIVDFLNELPLFGVGLEVSDLIGVYKYEAPEPKDESAKGGLPYNIGRTDEERYQNLNLENLYGEESDVGLKVDGQSNSFGYKLNEDRFFVLKRSLEVKYLEPQEDGTVKFYNNNFTQHIKTYDIENKLRNYCQKHGVSLCLRGESYGGNIQAHKANPHANIKNGWGMFSVYNIDEHKYERKGSLHYYLNLAKELDLPTVENLEEDVIITPELIEKYATGIEQVNGNYFEGVVINTAKTSFKVINLKYDSMK